MIIEMNWYNRPPHTEDWGDPDTVDCVQVDNDGEERNRFACRYPINAAADYVTALLSDEIDRELDHTENRCMRLRAELYHLATLRSDGSPEIDTTGENEPRPYDVCLADMAGLVTTEPAVWGAYTPDRLGKTWAIVEA